MLKYDEDEKLRNFVFFFYYADEGNIRKMKPAGHLKE